MAVVPTTKVGNDFCHRTPLRCCSIRGQIKTDFCSTKAKSWSNLAWSATPCRRATAGPCWPCAWSFYLLATELNDNSLQPLKPFMQMIAALSVPSRLRLWRCVICGMKTLQKLVSRRVLGKNNFFIETNTSDESWLSWDSQLPAWKMLLASLASTLCRHSAEKLWARKWAASTQPKSKLANADACPVVVHANSAWRAWPCPLWLVGDWSVDNLRKQRPTTSFNWRKHFTLGPSNPVCRFKKLWQATIGTCTWLVQVRASEFSPDMWFALGEHYLRGPTPVVVGMAASELPWKMSDWRKLVLGNGLTTEWALLKFILMHLGQWMIPTVFSSIVWEMHGDSQTLKNGVNPIGGMPPNVLMLELLQNILLRWKRSTWMPTVWLASPVLSCLPRHMR